METSSLELRMEKLRKHVGNAMYRWYTEEINKRIQDYVPERTDLIEYFSSGQHNIWYRDEILKKLNEPA